MMRRFFFVGLFLSLAIADSAKSDVVILSDNFSRSSPGTPVGNVPVRTTTTPSTWDSNWGANNNFAGGNVSQTYTTYVDTSNNKYKIDSTNGTSGNWLNNGAPIHVGGTVTNTTTEAIGLPGFGWVQINHDFSTNPDVQAASSLRIAFDVYRPGGGNIGWFFGQSDPTGVANGSSGSPATTGNNDVALFFRGTQAQTYGYKEDGGNPVAVGGMTSYDPINYTGANITSTTNTLSIQIDILGTNFSNGQSSSLELRVNGFLQDLNGTDAGSARSFSWNGTGAYMGFSSNNTAVSLSNGVDVYRASGIDNLVITAVPEPTSLALMGSAGLGVALRFLRRRRVTAKA